MALRACCRTRLLRLPLPHQPGDAVRVAVTACVELGDDARAVFGRAVLAELELAFEAVDRDLEPEDAAHHRVDKPLGLVLHPPRRRPARLVALGTALEGHA